MAITRSGQYAGQQVLLGYEPVFLVEILATNDFFTTRDPGFTGPWLAGEGLTAGSGGISNVAAAPERPVYDGGLKQLVDEGIASISYGIDSEGLARTGNTALEILNQELFHLTLQNNELLNAKIRIRQGFHGGDFSDYITIFQGSIERFVANYDAMSVELVDDTVNNAILTPPQLGADFFPQSVTVGRAIPIVLGDINFVPAIPISEAANSRLVFEFTSLDNQLSVFDDQPDQRFPANGELTINAEVFTYNRVKPAVVNGIPVIQFTQLTRTAPVLHAAGAPVTLTNVELLKMLAFYGGPNVRKLRGPDGVHPTSVTTLPARVLDPVGNDPRIVQTLTTSPEESDLTVSMSGENRGLNLIRKGDGNQPLLSPEWTVTNGTFNSQFTPGGESEPVIQGRVEAFQVGPSSIRQDVATVTGDRYRLTFSARLSGSATPPFQTVFVGTQTSPSAIHNFGQMTFVNEQGYDLVFTAQDTVTRITLEVDDTGILGTPEDAYWDHFQMYAVDTENPATSVQHLIERHIPSIQIDTDSFTLAEAQYKEVGDRLSGMVADTQEAQNLLGRIANQFRAKTWLTEDGKQKWKVFDNSEAPIAQFNPSNIDKGTMSITQEHVDSIYTHYYVYYNRRNDLASGALGGRAAYQGVMYATPEDTNHTEEAVLQVLCKNASDTFRVKRVKEIFCDMIPDAATAARLLSLEVRLHTHRRILAQWTTYLNGIHLEVTDFVKITHDLLPQFASGANFEILEKEVHPNGCLVSFVAAEIRQAAFGSFIENWEPLSLETPALIQEETWEPPPPLQIVENGQYPFIENWDSSVVWRQDLFDAWESDGGSFAVRELTAGLAASFEFNEAERATDQYVPVNRFAAPFASFGNNGNIQNRWHRSNPTSDGLNPPVFLPTGGPLGTFPALQFNHTDLSLEGGLVHGSSFINDRQDYTVSLWVLLESKPLESMPIIMNINDDRTTSNLNGETISYMLYWDAVTDRFRVLFEKFPITMSATAFEGESWIADMNNPGTGFEVQADTFGVPSLSTWYHIAFSIDNIPFSPLREGRIYVNAGSPNVGTTAAIPNSIQGVGWINPRGYPSDIFFPGGQKSDGQGRFDGYTKQLTGVPQAFGVGGQEFTAGTFAGVHPYRLQTGLPNHMGFHGRIALVNFYSRKLGDPEITTLYGGGTPPLYPYA